MVCYGSWTVLASIVEICLDEFENLSRRVALTVAYGWVARCAVRQDLGVVGSACLIHWSVAESHVHHLPSSSEACLCDDSFGVSRLAVDGCHTVNHVVEVAESLVAVGPGEWSGFGVHYRRIENVGCQQVEVGECRGELVFGEIFRNGEVVSHDCVEAAAVVVHHEVGVNSERVVENVLKL